MMMNIPRTMTMSSAVKGMPSVAMETMVTPMTAIAVLLLIWPNFTMYTTPQASRSITDLFPTGGQTGSYASPDVSKIRDAIAYNETRGVKGDPYASSQPSKDPTLGMALGKYRITEGTLKDLGPKYMKQPILPSQFLSDPAAQDNFMNTRIAALSAKGYTPQQIADMHRGGGINYPFPPGATTYRNPAYVASFNSAYNTQPRTVANLAQ